MPRRVWCVPAIVACVAIAGAARAEEEPPLRYGWVIFGADMLLAVPSIVAMAPGWDRPDAANVIAPALIYLATGPVVHLIKQRPARALKSLSLRVGLPLGLAGFGYLIGDRKPQHEWFSQATGNALIGGAIGVLIALIVDWSVLGHDDPPPQPGGVSISASPGALFLRGRF